jgi:hypothetical protein
MATLTLRIPKGSPLTNANLGVFNEDTAQPQVITLGPTLR